MLDAENVTYGVTGIEITVSSFEIWKDCYEE